MVILGIETSCDETGVGIVKNGHILLANEVATSMDLHAQYGGVVPEIAARSHIEFMMPTLKKALKTANCTWDDIDGIAVTYGAGLGGSLLIGVLTARTLSITHQKPLYAINHVEGHVYANFLTDTELPHYHLPDKAPTFPLLALIVSGGHSQLALFQNHFDYKLLGQTQDDAIGEAFDKVAKILGLPYPGGPSISKAAVNGDASFIQLPKAKVSGDYDFSFSGIKTAVLRATQKLANVGIDFPSQQLAEKLTNQQKADIAASFEKTAIETVVDKTVQAVNEYSPASVVIAGGVAANQELREQLKQRLPLDITYTDPQLCTDNGAMIAALGCYKAENGQDKADPFTLEIAPNLSM